MINLEDALEQYPDECPEINIFNVSDKEGLTKLAMAKAQNKTPSLYGRLPKRVAAVVGEMCDNEDQGHSMVYGYIKDGRFVRIADRSESLDAWPNLLALTDLFPEGDEHDAARSVFEDRIEELQSAVEDRLCTPYAMRKSLDYFLNVQNPLTDDTVEGVVPVYIRLTTRPEGEAPEEMGARAFEKHLLHFLTGIYEEAAVLVLDRTLDDLSSVTAELTWNWCNPPSEHPNCPVEQGGKYIIAAREFRRGAYD